MKRNEKGVLLSQLSVLRRNPGFFLAFFIMLIYAILSFVYQCRMCAGKDLAIIPDANMVVAFSSLSTWGLIEPVFPFLLVLPFAASAIQEQKNGTIYLILQRVPCKKFFLAKTVVSGLANFLITFLPLFVNFCLCNCFFPHNYNSSLGIYGMPSYFQALTGTNLLYTTQTPQVPFIQLYLFSPALYNLWHLFLLALTASVLGIWLTAISYYVRGRSILLFLPIFLLMRILGIFTERGFTAAMEDRSVQFVNYRLFDYCIPFSFPGKNWIYYIGFLGLLIVSTVVLYKFSERKIGENDVYI